MKIKTQKLLLRLLSHSQIQPLHKMKNWSKIWTPSLKWSNCTSHWTNAVIFSEVVQRMQYGLSRFVKRLCQSKLKKFCKMTLILKSGMLTIIRQVMKKITIQEKKAKIQNLKRKTKKSTSKPKIKLLKKRTKEKRYNKKVTNKMMMNQVRSVGERKKEYKSQQRKKRKLTLLTISCLLIQSYKIETLKAKSLSSEQKWSCKDESLFILKR